MSKKPYFGLYRNTNCSTILVHRNFRRNVHSKLWVSYSPTATKMRVKILYTNTDPSKVQITRKKSSYKMPRIKSSVCLLMQNNVLYPLVQKKSHDIRCKIPICLLQKFHNIRCKIPICLLQKSHASLLALCDERLDVVSIFTFQLLVWPLWPFEAFAGLTTWSECPQDQRDGNLTKVKEK